MLDEIKRLENISIRLESDPGKRAKISQDIAQFAESFLQSLQDRKAYVFSKENGAGLADFMPQEEARSTESILSVLDKQLLESGLNPASGGHLGYIPGGGIPAAASGDYLAAITNRYATVFYASPGAVRMENLLIRWMCRMVGYPKNSLGYLSSGGSMANLAAVVAARDAKNITPKNIEHSVIYLTTQAHHCIDKALRIAGLATCIRHFVPMNDHFQMDAAALASLIEKDKKDNLNPWLIIASAGTTDVGAIDPLDSIADIAEANHIWYHVDAAYGGFFLLSDKVKSKMKGISRADSIVMDPHKGLFMPYGSGALLVKNKNDLSRSFYYQANYMQDAIDPNDEISPAEISPELSRHFRGLRLWLPLQLYGIKPFRAGLEEKMLLAQYFYKEIIKFNFETGPEPALSVMIYRFVPEKIKNNTAAVNTFNESLLTSVLEDGRVFISSTTIDGIYWLRLAVLSFRTHLKHIQILLEILREKTSGL